MSSYSSASRATTSNNRSGINATAFLFLAVAFVSLLLAEQVATGWIAFGDQLNISRRDFNLTEIVVMAGCALWGVFALWTALNFARQRDQSIRAYLENNAPMPSGLLFSTVGIGLIGIICWFIVIQVLTGWLPLGARVNISRSNLNEAEKGTMVLGLIWGALCLRTALGFWRRESPAWSWGQWILFITGIAGLIILMSGVFDIPSIVPKNGTLFDNLGRLLSLLGAGLLLMLTSLACYRYVAAEYGAPAPQKAITGTLGERARARDISGSRSPAGQSIRNRLAKSPGAGAIIGFIAIFTLFSIATDLFLEPASLASALSNNVTRGIIAIGTTMLMISGEFDLSVGSMLGTGGLMFMGLITGQFPPGITPLHPVVAAVVTIAFICFLGFLNGFLLVRTQIPSFIVTLATLLMYRGIPLVFIVGGKTLRYVDYFSVPPIIDISRILIIIVIIVLLAGLGLIARSILKDRVKSFREHLNSGEYSDFRTLGLISEFMLLLFMTIFSLVILVLLGGSLIDQVSQLSQGSSFMQISFFDLMNGRISYIPFIGDIPQNINLRMGVFWWFILVIIFQFILNQTRFGNATFAVGGNPGAARAQGINVNRMKITNYMLLALLIGIASIFDASRLQSIDALRGQGLELEVIAATVIGGALLSGGYGSILGALLGVFIFGMMQTGLVLIGVDARLFDAIIGAIILIAVIINNWSRRIKV